MEIEGVVLKSLDTHVDQRGFFREIIRATDGFFEEGFEETFALKPGDEVLTVRLDNDSGSS